MLRHIRITLAAVFFIGLLLIFLDFTGTVHHYLGWMAKMQFWPALTSATVIGAGFAVLLIIITLVFGRLYCSVICPLGVMQDIMLQIGLHGRKNRLNYSKEKRWLRYAFLVLMVVLFPLGLSSLLEPYSAFGRIANTIIRPLWIWCNNCLAVIAESVDSYQFYRADVLLSGGVTLAVAIGTLVIVGVLASRNGRTYCNTVCPVGTILGFFARYSRLKIHINTDKCRNCGKCAKNCKAAAIDFKHHSVDYSRCVVCGDCLGECEFSAISYGGNVTKKKKKTTTKTDEKNTSKEPVRNGEGKAGDGLSRRHFLLGMAMASTATLLAQEKKKVDDGLAAITEKQAPNRHTPILPPGAVSMKHMGLHCTACQLCVTACENKVLRPDTSLGHFMQPVMSYEEGYCRPECHACSSVCPAEAIEDIGRERKASTKIGTAVFIKKNCVSFEQGIDCGNCARHCPTGAITMVPSDSEDDNSPLMPAVDETRCIGCGACENLCPARPFSAIYVEGIEVQKEV